MSVDTLESFKMQLDKHFIGKGLAYKYSSMKNVAEDWLRLIGQLKSCPNMGQFGAGWPKGCPKWGSSGQGSLNAAPKGQEQMFSNSLFFNMVAIYLCKYAASGMNVAQATFLLPFTSNMKFSFSLSFLFALYPATPTGSVHHLPQTLEFCPNFLESCPNFFPSIKDLPHQDLDQTLRFSD